MDVSNSSDSNFIHDLRKIVEECINGKDAEPAVHMYVRQSKAE